MTDRLRQTYRNTLYQIACNLDEEQQKGLQFLCVEQVPRRVKERLDLFYALEENKMSWINVSFLMECLDEIGKKDLAELLAKFEVKRNMFILLSFYVKKRNGQHSFDDDDDDRSSATELAEYLVQLMEGFEGTVEIRDIMNSSDADNKKDLWLKFVNECTAWNSRKTWSKFSMLVALAGESICASISIHPGGNSEEAIMDICIALADELYCPMLQLGSWVNKIALYIYVICRLGGPYGEKL